MKYQIGKVYSGAELKDAPEGTVVGLFEEADPFYPWRKKFSGNLWEGEEGTLVLGPIANYILMQLPEEKKDPEYPLVIVDDDGDVWVRREDGSSDSYFWAEEWSDAILRVFHQIKRDYGISRTLA